MTDLATCAAQSPALAGDRLFREFCTPGLSERRAADHALLVERARPFIRRAVRHDVATRHGPIPVFTFSPDGKSAASAPAVLVLHGWTAEAAFMAMFAERLVRGGYRAVLPEAPAHGHAKQRRASLIDWTRSILDIDGAMGPFEAVIAHSMGCLAALLAGAGGPPFDRPLPIGRYVLISPPNRIEAITQEFAEARRAGRQAEAHFERHLERIAHRPLRTLTGADLLRAIGKPALLIHARDDEEVPIGNSQEIASHCPNAEIRAFDGCGHRRILSQPAVARAAVHWLSEGSRPED
ncbi:MAG: alpha/beta fold hydrolase [Hyphomicrobium sp.]|nr:alpha/beta fold hydrolase [Hyphomicrobium sp.]